MPLTSQQYTEINTRWARIETEFLFDCSIQNFTSGVFSSKTVLIEQNMLLANHWFIICRLYLFWNCFLQCLIKLRSNNFCQKDGEGGEGKDIFKNVN